MRTPLYSEHVLLGAKMVDFHGWDMPLEYTGILKEHMAVRTSVGIFDVSHIGDVRISGKDSESFVNYLVPTDLSLLRSGHCIYTEFLNDDGLIIDDTIFYRLSDDEFFFVPNASTTETVLKWIRSKSGNFNVRIENVSDEIACIAVQGKNSLDVSKRMNVTFPDVFTFNQSSSDHFNSITGNNDMIISGTGYTGERGFEIICPSEAAVKVWHDLMDIIHDYDGLPCGLGSRDSLRMEKGMLLSGTDFSNNRDPYECSISFTVSEKGDFIGKKNLMKRKIEDREIFRGFITDTRIIPRGGSRVFIDGEEIGIVTSGTFSPVIGKSIALGFVLKNRVKIGDGVLINVRGKEIPARVSRPKMVP